MNRICPSVRIHVIPHYWLLTVFYCCTISPLHAQNAATALAPPSVIFEALALNHDIPTKKKPKYRSPTALVPSPDGLKLYVCNRFSNSLSVINTATQNVTKTVALLREPYASEITPDGTRLIIGNLLHSNRSTDTAVSCAVTFFDTEIEETIKNLHFIRGSKSILGLAVSPDGKYAFVTHLIAKFDLLGSAPTGGHIHTNNLNIIDISTMSLVITVSLDFANQGMANPWEITFASEDFPPDSSFLIIAHAGGNRISMIRYQPFIRKVLAASAEKIDLQQKFTYLLEDVRTVISSELTGTRALGIIGNKVYTAGYFNDDNPVMAEYPIGLYDSSSTNPAPVYHTIGSELPVTSERKGEQFFYDAAHCIHEWHSCHSCHPFTRTDGLYWIPNSGIAGTPKNSKSTLYSWWTPPCGWIGQRENAQQAIMTAIQIKLLMTPKESVTVPLDTFLMYQKPVSSPYLEKGRLSASAQRGRVLFNDPEKGGCCSCHKGSLFFDDKLHDIGVEDIYNPVPITINTPSLVECWRTAPYGHVGEFKNIREIIEVDVHTGLQQKAANGLLTSAQIDDLVAYVLSL